MSRKLLFFAFYLTVNGIVCVTPLLAAADSIPVPDVVVTASQESDELSNLANTTIITEAQIKNSGAADLVQLLQGQPGVQIYNTVGDPDQATFSLRGFGENAVSNTLILIDGRRLTNPDLGSTNLSTIPLSRIQRIEIFPGSAGVLYGDQAVGGVINIITKQNDTLNGDAGIQYGSYQTINTYASVANTFDNGFNLQFDGVTRNTDHYRDHNTLTAGNGSARAGYRYDSGSAFVQYQYNQYDLELPGALTESQVSEDRRQAGTYSENDFVNNTNNIFSSGFEQWLTSDWQVQADISQLWMQGDSIVTGIEGAQVRNITQLNPLLIGHYRFLKQDSTLKIGANLEHDEYHYETPLFSLFNVNDTQMTQSLYTQWQFPLSERLKAIVGIRGAWLNGTLNENNFNDHALVSEIGGYYAFSPQLNGYLRRSGNYRFPKADEQNNFDTDQTITVLKPQTGVSYETGFNWQERHSGITASLYELNLRNEIAYAPPDNDSDGRPTNRNLDPTERRGVLLSGFYDFTEVWRLLTDYSFVNGRYSSGPFEGNRIPLVAKNMARLATRYDFSSQWQFYTEALITGRTYASGDDTNQAPVAGYTIYNANLGYHNKAWDLITRINNITGKEYYNYVIYMSPDQYYYPADNRNILVTLRYKFL
ncbi:MAG: btuB [Gammaproteobacteria bacterium]|jgi:iron complex outermembrane receptor protein|nr:btuB [Gammaproteobacteria bacterium]